MFLKIANGDVFDSGRLQNLPKYTQKTPTLKALH